MIDSSSPQVVSPMAANIEPRLAENSMVGNSFNNFALPKMLPRSISSSPASHSNQHQAQGSRALPLRRSSRRPRRSKSSSNDLVFVERNKKYGQFRKNIPCDFEYKGKIKVKSMGRRRRHVPCSPQFPPFVPTYPMQPHPLPEMPPFQPPMYPHPPMVDVLPPCQSFPPYHGHMDGMQHYHGTMDGGMGQTHFMHHMMSNDVDGIHGFNNMDAISNIRGDGRSGGSGFPPIPPGAKIIAQYVHDLDSNRYGGEAPMGEHGMGSTEGLSMGGIPMGPPPMAGGMSPPSLATMDSHSMIGGVGSQMMMGPMMEQFPSFRPPCEPCTKLIDECVPKSKIIEVWSKPRKYKCHHHKSSSDSGNRGFKKEWINTITNELKRLEQTQKDAMMEQRQHWIQHGGKEIIHHGHPGEKEVKVIVQPIQPVFYMPREQGGGGGSAAGGGQAAGPPHVIYVPRNVYVPVIKPVFVPRERVIVRPQIVQVARPVVIDRPVPVSQRPIVIDRDRPVPFPVVRHDNPAIGQISHDQYTYRDNVPLAYGGRTGEFATGMNYGYVPVNENYQYIVSDAYRSNDLEDVASHRQHQVSSESFSEHHQTPHIYSSENINVDSTQPRAYAPNGFFSGDCFDEAIAESQTREQSSRAYRTYSGAERSDIQTIPVHVNSPGSHHYQHHQHINTSQPQIPPQKMFQDNTTALIQTLRRAGTGCVNLEVLDPTVRPDWEPINAKLLIQRYGYKDDAFEGAHGHPFQNVQESYALRQDVVGSVEEIQTDGSPVFPSNEDPRTQRAAAAAVH